VVRADETVRLMCRTNGSPIKKCQWEINGDLYELGEGQRFQPFGRLQDGECGIQATMSETENGPWTCHVFKEGSSRAEKASTNVTQLVLPNITLRPNAEPITVMAGQETEVSCLVEKARPAPGILWKIGDREIDSINRQSKSTPLRDSTQITIMDTLKYTFEAVDHNQVIRCLTVGPWLTENDPHEATAHLNVIFPPQPKEPTTLYGYVAGQAGDVVVNFTANPSPIRVYWKVEDDSQLNVVPYDGPSTNDRFEVYELKTTDQSAFEAKLRVRSVSESDARRNFRLFVESDLNGEQHVQEYIVRISMSAAPLQCKSSSSDCSGQPGDSTFDHSDSDLAGGVSGGGIAGIIIAVLAILVILAALLYARNTGQWCFAGGRRTVGEGESRARIDEENPGDIVKEKEGKEGPLKGSTENLNLALATDGNLENGNNGNLPPSPTKEQQQNGGSVSPSQDGKDTAV